MEVINQKVISLYQGIKEKTWLKENKKIVFGLFIVLCTNISMTQYTFAHSASIVRAVVGIALIVIGGIYFIINTLIFMLLARSLTGERHKKMLYIFSTLLIDIFIYVALCIVTYVAIEIMGRLAVGIFPTIKNNGIHILIVFLLLAAGCLSTFGVYTVNTLIAKFFLKEENKKKLLRISLIASILYNPIVGFGVLWLMLFLIQ